MEKVIFDTDPGVDDAMALLFLHRHPGIDLVGITTVFGNADVGTTTRNALFLAERWGIDAPVARGAASTFDPRRHQGAFPVFIHGENGLGNIDIPADIAAVPDPRPAHRFIIDTVKASPGEVTLIAVAPLTNLALAIREAPEIAGLVKRVILMGGAFAMHGNASPAAEANIHNDPEAADLVFTAAWPVTAIGLDVTTRTVMTRGELASIAAEGGEALHLLDDLSQFYMDFYRHRVGDGMVVHDTCACVFAVAPELFETRTGTVRVLTEGIAEGKTVLKPDGLRFGPSAWDGHPSQTICTHVDADAVLALIRKTLLGRV
ncbi:nucleoside hydrolase [Rhizobiaceae bacterium BDR2-2]|uniref:Nucleoside hydrolase n=1 Tax=Ectorhizobium quercum TaxID=2965071 RepID=A0AAE3N4Y7_9HYPH|nr:nucleoside hydrolase [Ectorhizobium quercum]MCX8999779.1 nucleoside hydrolase [Ectorhizobium quercum]